MYWQVCRLLDLAVLNPYVDYVQHVYSPHLKFCQNPSVMLSRLFAFLFLYYPNKQLLSLPRILDMFLCENLCRGQSDCCAGFLTGGQMLLLPGCACSMERDIGSNPVLRCDHAS